MAISPEEAANALQEIGDTKSRIKQLMFMGGDLLFIIWGSACLLGFLGAHALLVLWAYLADAGTSLSWYLFLLWSPALLWILLFGAGLVVSIKFVMLKQEPVKLSPGKPSSWFSPATPPWFWLWWALSNYAGMWASIFLVLPLLILFGYAVASEEPLIGQSWGIYASMPFVRLLFGFLICYITTIPIFLGSITGWITGRTSFPRFLLCLGLWMILVTMVGIVFLLPYLLLWMALSVGGVLIAAGLYSRLVWRRSLCRK